MPRLIQVIIAIVLIIVLSPLFLMVTMILMFPGPVIYSQKRTGKDNQPFTLYKFRTMAQMKDWIDSTDPHSTHRITRIGNILRKFSLDEIPQLWNIIRGDMNLIGPRPLPVEYLPRMNEKIRKRHQVYPGITGWAQVNGRNVLSWEDKFNLDIWYVENRTMLLDLKILFLTFTQIINKKGINQNEFQTMEEFMGSDEFKAQISKLKAERKVRNRKS